MKLLYFSQIAWQWIKQRPHFLSEELASAGYEVHYFYRYPVGNYRAWNNENKNIKKLVVKGYAVCPFALRFACIEKLNNFYLRKRVFQKDYDIVIFADPRLVGILPENYSGRVIYECMDLYGAFYSGKIRRFIEQAEKKLCARADHIVVSSENLRKHIINDCGIPTDKITLIRNAVSDKLFFDNNTEIFSPADFSYIGTIGKWFDWDAVIACAKALPQCKIRLVGPYEFRPSSLPENIELYGKVSHNKVPGLIKASKVLLMPFKLNELIKAVDPVKIYEYLSLGRNVLAPHYEELEHFLPNDRLNFYRTQEEFIRQAETLLTINTPAVPQNEFYQKNNWKERAWQLMKIL